MSDFPEGLDPEVAQRFRVQQERIQARRAQEEAERPAKVAAAQALASERAEERRARQEAADAARAEAERLDAIRTTERAAADAAQRMADATDRRAAEGLGPPADAAHAARVMSEPRLAGWGVPARVARAACVLDVDMAAEPVAAIGQPHELIVLSGPAGVGKSVAAALWAYGAGGALWYSGHELSRLSSRDEHEAQDRVMACAHLVVDDLGQEYLDKNGYLLSLIDWMIYERHGRMLKTCITTNLNAKTFTARYGERIVDRIRESGVFVELAGDSRRRKIAT